MGVEDGSDAGLELGARLSLPHAQHISFELKSSSSYPPHQLGADTYSSQPSPYGSTAPLSVSVHEPTIVKLELGTGVGGRLSPPLVTVIVGLELGTDVG